MEALRLIGSGDPEIRAVTLLTLKISGLATLLSVAVGVPAGMLLAVRQENGLELLTVSKPVTPGSKAS